MITKYTLFIVVDDEELIKYYSDVIEKRDLMNAGFDLCLPTKQKFKFGETTFVDLKIRCKMIKNKDEQGTAFYMYPRSSLSKTPLIMTNSVGIIDSEYRGTLKIALKTLSDVDYVITKHSCLVQICAPNLQLFDVIIVDTLDETKRGENGFGSTGHINGHLV